MGISETKKRIVIDNYFKTECNIDTSIREAFKKGFELGLQKAPRERKTGKWVFIHPLQEDDGGAYVCSCCGTGSWEIDPARWKACPWCTALMEGEE